VSIVPVRIRFVGVLAGVLAVAGAFGAQGSLAASIVLSLTQDNVLEVRLDNGARLRASSAPVVIAPGLYQAIVISEVPESRDDYHMFHLVGPGVNLQTDLLAGDERAEPHTVTLQPSSVYSFRDDRNLSLGTIVFSTSGAGTAVTGGSSGGGSSGGSSGTTSNTPTSTSSNKDPVGSRAVKTRGALAGGVTTAGKLSLTFKGKAVNSLKSGRYTISVLDETSKSGFVLQLRNQKPVTVSGKSHIGRRTVTVTLKAGQWTFSSAPGAKKTFFVVTN
jgi:hypothetical protein